MNSDLITAVHKRIAEVLQIRAEVEAEADYLKAQGDLEGYYRILFPDLLGDLYYFIDDITNARNEWQRDLNVITGYKQTMQQLGKETSPSYLESSIYWRNGDLPNACAILLNVLANKDDDEKRNYAISLRNCGDKQNYQQLLQSFKEELANAEEETPAQKCKLAEICFWLGDLNNAIAFSRRSVELLSGNIPMNSMYIITFSIFLNYWIYPTEETKKKAVETLEELLTYYVAAKDTFRAMDIKEYLYIVNTVEPRKEIPEGVFIVGVTMDH